MKWETVKLVDITSPKQWKTISTDMLTADGYHVYGANGIIGKYKEYTHEIPTVLITCRGATCGNIHISQPFSYINGNAMALDKLSSNVSLRYLYYFLLSYDFSNVISGSAQPQITIQGLQKVEIPLPPLHIQEQIADTLDKADTLRRKDKELLQKYDQLAQAIFYDMFGDPVRNERGWDQKQLSDICTKLTVGFVGQCEKYYTDESGIILLRTGNISEGSLVLEKIKYVTQEFHQKNKKSQVGPGDILIARHGDNGKACLIDEKVADANVLNAVILRPNSAKFSSDLLVDMLNNSSFRDYMSSFTGGATQKVINTKALAKLIVVVPPIKLQNEFSRRKLKLSKVVGKSRQILETDNSLFSKLISNFF